MSGGMSGAEYISTLIALKELIDQALAEAVTHVKPKPEQTNMEVLYSGAQAAICRARSTGLSSSRMSAVIGGHTEWRWAWPSGNSIGYLRAGNSAHGIKSGEKLELIARALNEHCDSFELGL